MTDLQADVPTPAIMMLEVINRNDFTINDMFNGVPIVFPPGQKVDTSPEVANHCFGYPGELQDRALHMAKRYGWSGKDYLKAEGLGDGPPRYFLLAEKVEIKPIYYDLVRRNPNDPIPLDTGDEADDRPQIPDEPDTTTRVGRRKKAKPLADRHRPNERVSSVR